MALQVSLIGVSLSMDTFAVSVCNGMCYRNMNLKKGGEIALIFGSFQMIMPLIGFFVILCLLRGIDINIIDKYDHWIAFVILMIIGVKMLADYFLEIRKPKEQIVPKRFSIAEVLVQGLATSIDALAVGVSFIAMYSDGITEFTVCGYAGIIGTITVIAAAAGVYIGWRIGKLFERRTGIARLFGGFILIGIGLKILIEGLI